MSKHEEGKINWDEIVARGFKQTRTDAMFLCRFTDGRWIPDGSGSEADGVVAYGTIELEPSATVLNYGQGIFEGMKAFRLRDGRVAVFRPDLNVKRCQRGASRFLMPPVPEDLFLDAIEKTVRRNEKWVPPHQLGALYLRPMVFGSGGGLGVGPSSQYIFCVWASPVGDYFRKNGTNKGVSLMVQRKYHRAVSGGCGDVKAIGNYAMCFQAQAEAKELGFSDVLFLDETNQRIEEAGASNFFAIRGKKLLTPPVSKETILDGCTRRSIMEIAHSLELQVVEDLLYADLPQCDEAFCCGTGAGLSPVSRIHDHENQDKGRIELSVPGPITQQLTQRLREIQWGLGDTIHPWMHVVL